jgi:hypothetical protein
MGEGLGATPEQELVYELEMLTGPELDTRLLELVLLNARTLSVDGVRLLCVDSRYVNPETCTVTVECRDEERQGHRLTYSLEDGSPIAHEFLKERPDPRTER